MYLCVNSVLRQNEYIVFFLLKKFRIANLPWRLPTLQQLGQPLEPTCFVANYRCHTRSLLVRKTTLLNLIPSLGVLLVAIFLPSELIKIIPSAIPKIKNFIKNLEFLSNRYDLGDLGLRPFQATSDLPPFLRESYLSPVKRRYLWTKHPIRPFGKQNRSLNHSQSQQKKIKKFN